MGRAQPLPSERGIALHCEVSRQTVARFVRGEAIRPASKRRIVRGLVELGVLSGETEIDEETRCALGLNEAETT